MKRLLNDTRHGASPCKTVLSDSQTTFPSHPESNHNNNYTKELRKNTVNSRLHLCVCVKKRLHLCHHASLEHKETQAAALLTPKAPSSILESYVPAYTVVSFYSSLQKSMTSTYYGHILTKWDSRNFGQHIKRHLFYL
jgi:hypothetical protein